MSAYLEQLRELWQRLSTRQRAVIGFVAVLIIAAFFLISREQREQSFKPLFQNVAGEDAAPVVNRLREMGVEFRLADNGTTIKVPADRLDELRIQMASAGLPKSGRIGFELFDNANFGASEFSEQVNFHRAIEGELERSVMSLSEVEQARVHITFAKNRIFLARRESAKASVMIKLRPGAKLSPQNIQAVTHLTASAVEGLSPDQVSVLDVRGNLLNRPKKEDPNRAEPSEAILAYRTNLEKDLLGKIQDTLEPLLGPNRFRAAVSLDCDLASGDQSEETYDPTRSVMVTAQRSEDGSGIPGPSGIPGTPSNLPRPTSRPGTAGTAAAYRKSENTTFQTSRVVRRIQFPQGQIKRLSVSVLLDHVVRQEGQKRIVEAPSPERVKSIRDVVAAVVGFQEDRGDLLTVEALPFVASLDPVETMTPTAPKPRVTLPLFIPDWLRIPLEGHAQWLVEQRWLPALIVAIVLVVLALPFVLLRWVLRSVKTYRLRQAERRALEKAQAEAPPSVAAPAIDGGQSAELPAPGPRDAIEYPPLDTVDAKGELRRLREQLSKDAQERDRITLEAIQALRPGEVQISRMDVLQKFIAEQVEKEPERMAHIVRAWLREVE
ncbi:MAG: flagellar basal-body MS-ring/collar protein FliF [Acidobacteriota bacterium]